jgi:dTDP-4-amino-4,6-dideoxygalactose transaminase
VNFYNCRSAIYELARAWNLAGEDVLFPSYCCGVELEALLVAGVTPRIYPVRQNMCVDVADIEAMVTPDTKAIYLIHYLGFPGPLEPLVQFCRDNGILLIEDGALALFSRLGNRPLGSFGDAAAFSLYKSLPVPSGGCLVLNGGPPCEIPKRRSPPFIWTVTQLLASIELTLKTNDMDWIRRILRGVRYFGRPVKRTVKSKPVVPVNTGELDLSVVKFGMSRVNRWILNARSPDAIVQRRRSNFEYLLGRLASLAPPVFPSLPEGVCPLFYAFSVDDNQAVMQALERRGVQSWAWWDVFPEYIGNGKFPETDAMRRTIVVIPCHESLSQQVLMRMADAVTDVLDLNGP